VLELARQRLAFHPTFGDGDRGCAFALGLPLSPAAQLVTVEDAQVKGLADRDNDASTCCPQNPPIPAP
jgi:hypothetical protein